MSVNEELLLRAVNHKEDKEWAHLYQSYYAPLCVYVNGILKGSEHAEDLVQDIFISLWKSSKSFDSIGDLTNYLYRACYNNSLLFIRNNQIHNTILSSFEKSDEEDDFYLVTIREEVIRQLYNHIKDLPREQQKVFLLRIEGHSWEKIAEILGLSINTIKTHRSRGLKFLREKLKDSSFYFLLYLL